MAPEILNALPQLSMSQKPCAFYCTILQNKLPPYPQEHIYDIIVERLLLNFSYLCLYSLPFLW